MYTLFLDEKRSVSYLQSAAGAGEFIGEDGKYEAGVKAPAPVAVDGAPAAAAVNGSANGTTAMEIS